MKISASLIVLFLLFSLLSSCIQEEADQCVNALDCFNGFVCVDGMCVDPNAGTGDKDSVQSDSDSAVTPDSDADQTVSDGQTDDQDDAMTDTDIVQADPDQQSQWPVQRSSCSAGGHSPRGIIPWTDYLVADKMPLIQLCRCGRE